jgi:alpha-1,2-mannosyltransferase
VIVNSVTTSPENDVWRRITSFVIGFSSLLIPFYVFAFATILAPTSDGRTNRSGGTFGHDFSQVWVAGTSALAGRTTEPWETPVHLKRQREVFGPRAELYGWHYPPIFLGVAALLATLPYVVAYFVWIISTSALFLWGLWRLLPRPEILITGAAAPLFMLNIGYGQNAALTAGLMSTGLSYLTQRPWIAGFCFGLLAYKPHLAIVVPIALAAGGYWRALVGAVVTASALALGSWLAFGTVTWLAFFNSLAGTEDLILQQAISKRELNMSGFGAVRLLDGSMQLAYAVQSVLTVSVIAALALCWRRNAPEQLKWALLLAAVPLTSPYVPEYDLLVLIAAAAAIAAWVVSRGVEARDFMIMGPAYIGLLAPKVAAQQTGLPIGFAMALLIFAHCLMEVRRARMRAEPQPQAQ